MGRYCSFHIVLHTHQSTIWSSRTKSSEPDALNFFSALLVRQRSAHKSTGLTDKFKGWHQKWEKISADRFFLAVERVNGVPNIIRENLNNTQCIRCMSFKSNWAPITQPIYRKVHLMNRRTATQWERSDHSHLLVKTNSKYFWTVARLWARSIDILQSPNLFIV